MKKGFALDDDRLKRLGGGNYFDELLARIRDIRSSEKVFWRKVLEIYATSIDYDPHAESSVLFFKQVQNKMHWAAHKHTAAEVIYERADAEKENMGLTSWEHDEIRRSDVEVAKNYLTEQELDALNKIVTAYLDIAEVHALNKEPMYMKDWLETIDDYLKMTRRDILTSSGHISHKQAIEKAHTEYDKYNRHALASDNWYWLRKSELPYRHWQESALQALLLGCAASAVSLKSDPFDKESHRFRTETSSLPPSEQTDFSDCCTVCRSLPQIIFLFSKVCQSEQKLLPVLPFLHSEAMFHQYLSPPV